MDTLCSQAYGAGQFHALGIYFQTGVLVLGLAFVPVFLLNIHCTEILLVLGQPKAVATLAGEFWFVSLKVYSIIILNSIQNVILSI